MLHSVRSDGDLRKLISARNREARLADPTHVKEVVQAFTVQVGRKTHVIPGLATIA